MRKVLVVFSRRYGPVFQMAAVIAEGARREPDSVAAIVAKQK
jgi:hypothetical protein